ncbi:MAG: DUF6159 family protein [Methanoregula sp.]|jgi:hypothetical protein|uniref:DUF6159 family protein n=1 Tax=Methanoregula sp. TaxID=2052170 RepID=UPI003D14192F
MNRHSDARWWLGLCRKAPAVRAAQAGMGNQPEPVHEGRPDGGGGGSKTVRRGIGAALSGTKTLIHNRQLLWFSLLVGLVLAGHLIAQWMLFVLNPFPFYGPDLLQPLVLTFAVEFSTVFCLVFLLAGLALSLSPEKGGSVSFFHGLNKAKKYLRPLTGWSVVVALAGTLIFTAGQDAGTLLYIAGRNSYSLDSAWFQPFTMISTVWSAIWQFLFNVLNQIPFNYILYPDLYVANLPGGENGIEFAFVSTLILSAINVILFVLTLFVVPLLVLEERRLKEAVSGSFTLMKNIWGEVAACVLGLGVVVFAASLTFLLFQLAAGIVALDLTWRPGDLWIASGFLYILALSGLAVVAATVGGIATQDLYTSAKAGHMPGSAETESIA